MARNSRLMWSWIAKASSRGGTFREPAGTFRSEGSCVPCPSTVPFALRANGLHTARHQPLLDDPVGHGSQRSDPTRATMEKSQLSRAMSLAEHIAPHLPNLRRFARLLTGSQSAGDTAVARLLEAIVVDASVFPDLPPRIGLYQCFLSAFTTRMEDPAAQAEEIGITAGAI